MSLRDYTRDELYAELARREGPNPRELPWKAIPHCDECTHFRSWSTLGTCPSDYNPCEFKHRLSFKLPEEGPNDLNWGFYRKRCPDRKPLVGASHEQSCSVPAPPRTADWHAKGMRPDTPSIPNTPEKG